MRVDVHQDIETPEVATPEEADAIAQAAAGAALTRVREACPWAEPTILYDEWSDGAAWVRRPWVDPPDEYWREMEGRHGLWCVSSAGTILRRDWGHRPAIQAGDGWIRHGLAEVELYELRQAPPGWSPGPEAEGLPSRDVSWCIDQHGRVYQTWHDRWGDLACVVSARRVHSEEGQ